MTHVHVCTFVCMYVYLLQNLIFLLKLAYKNVHGCNMVIMVNNTDEFIVSSKCSDSDINN